MFNQLSEEEREHCSKLSEEWNAEGIPDEVVRKCGIFIDLYETFLMSRSTRASKKIPSEVAEWTQYMKRHNGAVFFILAAYTNANGELTVSRSGVCSIYSDIAYRFRT